MAKSARTIAYRCRRTDLPRALRQPKRAIAVPPKSRMCTGSGTGANDTPRHAVLVGAVATEFIGLEKAPLYPDGSVIETSSLAVRIAKRVADEPDANPVRPRNWSAAAP